MEAKLKRDRNHENPFLYNWDGTIVWKKTFSPCLHSITSRILWNVIKSKWNICGEWNGSLMASSGIYSLCKPITEVMMKNYIKCMNFSCHSDCDFLSDKFFVTRPPKIDIYYSEGSVAYGRMTRDSSQNAKKWFFHF